MELWFIAALSSVLLAGISNFMFKVAAKLGHNGESFTFYGGVISTVYITLVVVILQLNIFVFDLLFFVMFAGGVIAATTNILKVHALRCVDTTIYFPLYKLLAPGLAIVAGYTLFGERFTSLEWIGMFIGLTVPLLLISKTESSRQSNLWAGLVLVVITSATSAVSAILFKYGIDGGMHVVIGLFYASIGIVIGSLISSSYKVGVRGMYKSIRNNTSKELIIHSGVRSLLITTSFGLVLYAYEQGGTLAIVQTINSFYILIPIVLAVIFYHEHINTQKVIAIILSVGSLMLVG